jgi:hypothetical protein
MGKMAEDMIIGTGKAGARSNRIRWGHPGTTCRETEHRARCLMQINSIDKTQ